MALGYSMLALFLSAVGARATTVVPPSFTELVSEAQVIARASVKSIESRWVETQDRRVIKTFVTFVVEKRLKGEAPQTLTLEFLGGTVGADSLNVSGMPKFDIGDCELVFVSGNGVRFCPLVRFAHGRYRVRGETQSGHKYIVRDDELPVTSIEDIELPIDEHGAEKAAHKRASAMTCDDFEAHITAEVARNAR